MQKKFDLIQLVDGIVSETVEAVARDQNDLFVYFDANKQWYRVIGAANRLDEMVYADSPNRWYRNNLMKQYPVSKLIGGQLTNEKGQLMYEADVVC